MIAPDWFRKNVLTTDKFAGSEFERPQTGPKGGGQAARNKAHSSISLKQYVRFAGN